MVGHKVTDEIILHCARTDADIKHIASLIESNECPIDWEEIILQARMNKVSSLLYNALNSTGVLQSPKSHFVQLRKKRAIEKEEHSLALKELDRFSKAANSEGLRPILFKGLSLAAYYGDSSLRKVGDFDILVRKDEISATISVAQKLGYVFGEWSNNGPMLFDDAKIEKGLDELDDAKHLPEMILPRSKLAFRATLEIHRNVVVRRYYLYPDTTRLSVSGGDHGLGDPSGALLPPSRSHDFDAVGASTRAQEVEIGTAKVWVLDPVDAIWACALNLQRDAEYIVDILFGRDLHLSRYCDIHELLLRSPEDTCAILLNRVKTPEARRACSHALRVTEAFFPGTVPPGPLSETVAEYPNAGNRIFYGRTGAGSVAEKVIGTWPYDVPERIFNAKRAQDIIHMWWGIGREVLTHDATERVRSRLGISPPQYLFD